jgi:TPR repeat protein
MSTQINERVEQSYNRKILAVTAAFTASDEQLRAELKAVERRSSEHVVALTSAVEIQSAQNASLAAQLQQAQTELEQRGMNVETHQRENPLLKAQVEQHQKRISELTAANLEARRQIEQCQFEISALTFELANTKTTSKNEITALIAEKDQKQQALLKQEENCEKNKRRISTLRSDLENSVQELAQMKEAYQKQQQQLFECNATVEQNKAKIAKLTATQKQSSVSEEKTQKLLADTANLLLKTGKKLYNDNEISKGSPKAAKFAANLFKEAVALGSTEALFWRGLVLHKGSGTPVDYVEAKRNFELSIEKASDISTELFMMHYFSRDGTGGVEQSYPKAAEWLDKAIAKGHRGAMVAKAEFYLEGHPGIPKNVAEAKKLLKLAADIGHKDAMQKLEALCAELGELDELLYTQEPPANSIQVLDLSLFS